MIPWLVLHNWGYCLQHRPLLSQLQGLRWGSDGRERQVKLQTCQMLAGRGEGGVEPVDRGTVATVEGPRDWEFVTLVILLLSTCSSVPGISLLHPGPSLSYLADNVPHTCGQALTEALGTRVGGTDSIH